MATDSIPGYQNETAVLCPRVTSILGTLGDKWSVLTLRTLGRGPFRFNALRREVDGISQKMLASTLRNLERNGLVIRTVTPATPPQVEYALTPLGESIQQPICAIAQWAVQNAGSVEQARRQYDTRMAEQVEDPATAETAMPAAAG